ncbi:MAG: PaaI family thioesterase [Bacteroidia bacterium]|nr:PaaI family thioesterase [Bacteroidia bacterium]
MNSQYFQDYMPGNVCFGCGNENPDGLQIKSFWEGEEAVCIWDSERKYEGWKNITNGGILATLVDCHCMCSAMAAVYKAEGRGLDSSPEYRYATGTLSIKYLKPTPNDKTMELRATVSEIKGRKVVMHCKIFSEGIQTAEADVIAIRVFEGKADKNNPFVH